MTVSGSCGALRAIEHYEDIGWISSGLRDRLVDIIGGPSLDTSVDPTQFPQEPTAETHAMSHDYLRVLANLQDL
jgi:archaellum component FlaD/FlaE